MTFLQFAIGYILARIVVALVLLPSYFKGELFTAYEVLAQRFGGATQKAASILFLVTRTLGSGIRLFLAAKVHEIITGWRLEAPILVIGASTLLYTYLGGLKGVIWADVLQFAVYMLGAFVALFVVIRAVPGGWSAIVSRAGAAGKFRAWDFTTDLTVPYTFWAGAIGAMVLDMGTHGADQMMVQRYLSARSQRQAAGALVASGFVILAQFTLFLFLGAAIWVLYQIVPPPVTPGKDQEFASFIVRYLPTSVLGLVIAAVFSVTMSTVSGALSASESSTVNDLLRPMLPDREESWLLGLSKALTGFWGLVQIGVAFGAMGLNQAVIDNALAIASFVTGILLGLFLLGLLSRRAGQGAAFLGMVVGLAVVSALAFGTKVAYPWYALVGSATVCLVGGLASLVQPEPVKTAVPEGVE